MNGRLRGVATLALIMAAAAQNNDVYGIPEPISSDGDGGGPTRKMLGAGGAPELHKFTIQGHTVMAENRVKAIKKLVSQGKIKDKKKDKKKR